MGKKKKTPRTTRVSGIHQPRPRQIPKSPVPPSDPVDAAKQREVVGRLAKAFGALSAAPETVLSFLDRVGVRYNLVENVPEDKNYDTIVIRMSDIAEADKRILAEGSILQRLYGEASHALEETEVKTFGQSEPIARHRAEEFNLGHRAGESTPVSAFDEVNEMLDRNSSLDDDESEWLKGMRG